MAAPIWTMPKCLTTETVSTRFRTVLVADPNHGQSGVIHMSTPSLGLRMTGAPISRAGKMQDCTRPHQTTAHGVQSFPIV